MKGNTIILTPEEALKQLQAGNLRYAKGGLTRPHQDGLRRAEVATNQNPFAVVVGCSDSRVPVEVIFDVGVGDLFVIRTAGNLMEDVCIASVEYGIAALSVRLVMVMGHRRCGAVSAAIEATLASEKRSHEYDNDPAHDRPPSLIDGLVEKIQPAVDKVRHEPGNLLDNAVRANAELMVRRMRKRSWTIYNAEKSGQVKLVPAVYDLDTGLVEIISG